MGGISEKGPSTSRYGEKKIDFFSMREAKGGKYLKKRKETIKGGKWKFSFKHENFLCNFFQFFILSFLSILGEANNNDIKKILLIRVFILDFLELFFKLF